MKLSTLIIGIIIGTAMLGYLYYGWLLLQTVMSGTSFEITVEFTILFLFWLLTIIGTPILITVDWLQNRRKRNDNVEKEEKN